MTRVNCGASQRRWATIPVVTLAGYGRSPDDSPRSQAHGDYVTRCASGSPADSRRAQDVGDSVMARMPETIRVDLSEIVGRSDPVVLRLEVGGQRRFSARLWLTGKLIALAARVSPVPMEIET